MLLGAQTVFFLYICINFCHIQGYKCVLESLGARGQQCWDHQLKAQLYAKVTVPYYINMLIKFVS